MPTTTAAGNVVDTLQGFDIVCLGTVEWLVVRSTAEPTMLRLAKTNRVLWVEPFRSLPTMFRELRWQRRGRKKSWGIRRTDEGLWVYSPPPIGLPGVTRWPWSSRINGWILGKLLNRAMVKLGLRDPLLWTFRFDADAVIKRRQWRLSIYDCLDQDEALARSEKQRRMVRELDSALCRDVDVVFGITEYLVNARRVLNPHSYEVNGAADLEFFGQALQENIRVPDDLARLGGPVVGYMGGVDPFRMDVSLLTYLARERPQWNIVLVGYVWFGFNAEVFRPFPNIHVLGPKPYADFPRYLKGMDVCIMPFPLNDLTRNGDSLKCYEYLAAGKPVVSTPVPSALRLPQVVRIADTPTAFLSAIEASLEEGSRGIRRRVEAVQPFTWENRVARKAGIILQRLAEKDAQRNAHE
jgi:glycosyltransferase involved in cell wall biosynthesis